MNYTPMKQTYGFGTTTPYEERCAQLGSPHYITRAHHEVQAFAGQLIRLHGNPPDGARLKPIYCEHDFGTYLDLALVFNDANEEHTEWMLKIENGFPSNWDQAAITELQEAGYFDSELV